MRVLLFILATLGVMGLGYWAYVENYRTQASIAQVEELQHEIGRMREERAVLRAEWAYLNRPDRLRDLAELNFDRLGLLPLTPEQFGRVDEVPYPTAATAGAAGAAGLPSDLDGLDGLDIAGAVDLRGNAETEGGE